MSGYTFPQDLIQTQRDWYAVYAQLAGADGSESAMLRRRLLSLSRQLAGHPYWATPVGASPARLREWRSSKRPGRRLPRHRKRTWIVDPLVEARERASGAALAIAERLAVRNFWIDRATLRAWLDELETQWPDSGPHFNLGLAQLEWNIRDTSWPELREHSVFEKLGPWTGPPGTLPPLTMRAYQTNFIVIAVAIGSAGLLPVLQAIATQAGNHAYDAARGAIRALIGRKGQDQISEFGYPGFFRIAVHEDHTGLSFVVPPNLPDEALRALTETDLDALATPPQAGDSVIIAWNEQTQAWERRLHKPRGGDR